MKFGIIKAIQEREYIVAFASSVGGIYRRIREATPKEPSPVHHAQWRLCLDGANVAVACDDVATAVNALFGKGFKSDGFRHGRVMGDDQAFAIIREGQATPFAIVRVYPGLFWSEDQLRKEVSQ